jgi:hypothetical protein
VARAASLIAVAILPVLAGITGDSYLHPEELTSGFHKAMLIAAVVSAAGGVLAFATITNPRAAAVPPVDGDSLECLHCGLDAPPLRTRAG